VTRYLCRYLQIYLQISADICRYLQIYLQISANICIYLQIYANICRYLQMSADIYTRQVGTILLRHNLPCNPYHTTPIVVFVLTLPCLIVIIVARLSIHPAPPPPSNPSPRFRCCQGERRNNNGRSSTFRRRDPPSASRMTRIHPRENLTPSTLRSLATSNSPCLLSASAFPCPPCFCRHSWSSQISRARRDW
jgi:hypothetical protein